ncbi:MAG: thioredoxin family protein [Polyangiaceae bacterium]
MRHLDDTTFDAAIADPDRPVLVDFSAAWCGPCKQQRPVLERFAREHPEVDVCEVDVDRAPAVAQRFGIQAMPTLLLFSGGEVRAQVRGLSSARRLERLLEEARS